MSRAPFVIAGLVVASSLAWTVHLAGAPHPFSIGSGLVLALGMVMFAVIDAAGLLLSRGRWARRLALLLAAGGGLVFVASDWRVSSGIALGLTAASAVGTRGPWLDGWIRRRPSAEGPGPRPMGVVFGSLGLLPLAGAVTPGTLEVWHGVLGATGVLLAWGYARAHTWGLWAIRLGLPAVAVPAMVTGPWAGAVAMGAAVGVVVALAWTRHARLAVQPLLDRLPGPRIGTVADEASDRA